MDFANMDVAKAGLVRKKGTINPAYKSRWFELEAGNQMLLWYAKKGDPQPKGIIKLTPEVSAEMSKDSAHGDAFVLMTQDRTYKLRGSSVAEAEDWVRQINKVTSPENVLDWSAEGALHGHTQIPDSEVEIGTFINAGTSGAVYKGTFRGQPVALKKLNVPTPNPPARFNSFVELLAKELNVLKDLQPCDYVLRYYGVAEQPQKRTATIVTELCDSDMAGKLRSIRQHFSSRRLPLSN
eukprot:g2206.t1